MAAEIYTKEFLHSPLHGTEASEVIKEGDFVDIAVGGAVSVADTSGGDMPDGIVPRRQRGDVLREHEEDYGPKQYDVGDEFVPFYPFESGGKLTAQAVEAAEEVKFHEPVAFDANADVVPAGSGSATTDAFGVALGYAESGEGVSVKLD